MKRFALKLKARKGVLAMMMFVAAAAGSSIFVVEARAQANELSLADILIALRSKKVSLIDRNKILSEAIGTRGTTFALTPEIEKELSETGATKALLDSIRQRSQIAKVSTVPKLPTETKIKNDAAGPSPVVKEPLQDLAFFMKRAQDGVDKGDLDAALLDYTKAVDMDGSSVAALMGRGRTLMAKKAYMLASADFTKVIGLDEKNAIAFAQRAEANEDQGKADLAIDDYKKAFALDPTIEKAKTAVERFNAEQAKLAAKTEPVATQKTESAAPPVAPPPAVPDFINLGQINEGRATKMIKPIYPEAVLRMGTGGEVVVDIELDAEGNVTKANAISGNVLLRKASEDAALRSKFKPATFGTTAVKGKARLVYRFSASR